MAELEKWKANQEAINRAREDRFEKNLEEKRQERANMSAASKNGSSVTPTGDNASDNSVSE